MLFCGSYQQDVTTKFLKRANSLEAGARTLCVRALGKLWYPVVQTFFFYSWQKPFLWKRDPQSLLLTKQRRGPFCPSRDPRLIISTDYRWPVWQPYWLQERLFHRVSQTSSHSKETEIFGLFLFGRVCGTNPPKRNPFSSFSYSFPLFFNMFFGFCFVQTERLLSVS